MTSVLVAASTLGAAQALAPVVTVLHARGIRVEARVPAGDGAIAKTLDLNRLRPDEGRWTHALVGVRRDPTGSATSLEQQAVDSARARVVPCVAVVDGFDTWFPRTDRAHPRQLAVPDRVTARLIAARGFPERALAVTGNPALQVIPDEERARLRAAVRQRLGLANGKRSIAYVTQPSVDIADRLPKVQQALQVDNRLIVFAHPRDQGNYGDVEVRRLDDPTEVAGFDAVLFHSSTLGLYAMLAGVPAVCVMSVAEWDAFAVIGGYPPVVLGLCDWAGDDIAGAIASSTPANVDTLRRALLLDGRAAERIASLLLDD